MRTAEFRRLLDNENAARVRFDVERGRVSYFLVPLECLIEDKWHPVVRFDTAHGFAHRDVMHADGDTEKTMMAVGDNNEALTFAIDDLTKNWEAYRRRYERWLK